MKRNKERIAELRSENQLLRSKLSKRMKADDGVVAAVFRGRNLPIPAELKGISGTAAIAKFDQTICELIKRSNALQHLKCSRAKVLANLESQLQEMKAEEDSLIGSEDSHSQLRQLENKLDKVTIKNNESKHIRKTYQAILDTLQEVKGHCSCGLHDRGYVTESVWSNTTIKLASSQIL